MDSLSSLPSVDQVLRELQNLKLPRALLVQTIRRVIAERRDRLLANETVEDADVVGSVRLRLAALTTPSLRRVINATGVVLHTNLGRAPLPPRELLSGYSNLEYDVETGCRGKRDAHTSGLLQALLERPAIVVNNNAAAIFLVLHELASGREVIVSRSELIEIGDGFRIPEIMARAGVVLREVGTTNRTSLRDYVDALNSNTGLILRVHPSNFHISGFTAKPALTELCALGREQGVPVYEDLGSGCPVDLRSEGIEEPLVKESLQAGVNVVSFSCDKLLGGPQSGIIAGDGDRVARIRRNPMYRALRIDKLAVEALETTLRHLLLEEWDTIPALRMIRTRVDTLKNRAERIVSLLNDLSAHVTSGQSPIGGGSTPDQTLPTWLVELMPPHAARFERALRQGSPPVIARIVKDRVVFDMRTVSDEEVDDLVLVAQQAFEHAQVS